MYFEEVVDKVNHKFQIFSKAFFYDLTNIDEAKGIMDKWEEEFKNWALPLNKKYNVNITWKAKLIETIKEGKGRQVIGLVIKRNDSDDDEKSKQKSVNDYVFLTENGFWSGFEG